MTKNTGDGVVLDNPELNKIKGDDVYSILPLNLTQWMDFMSCVPSNLYEDPTAIFNLGSEKVVTIFSLSRVLKNGRIITKENINTVLDKKIIYPLLGAVITFHLEPLIESQKKNITKEDQEI